MRSHRKSAPASPHAVPVLTVTVLSAAVLFMGCGDADVAREAATAADATVPLQGLAQGLAPEQEAFWERMQSHCGKAYAGNVSDITDYYRASFPEGVPLVMHVMECTEDRIHIPFHEGDDRSRNWILTRVGGTLRLKHDHRHEDGTEDAITQYGGDAPSPGLPERQIFPSDAHTASILPLRADNFWFFHFVDDQRLHYGVHWPKMGHSIRIEFDLSTPVEPPPRPWGY